MDDDRLSFTDTADILFIDLSFDLKFPGRKDRHVRAARSRIIIPGGVYVLHDTRYLAFDHGITDRGIDLVDPRFLTRKLILRLTDRSLYRLYLCRVIKPRVIGRRFIPLVCKRCDLFGVGRDLIVYIFDLKLRLLKFQLQIRGIVGK